MAMPSERSSSPDIVFQPTMNRPSHGTSDVTKRAALFQVIFPNASKDTSRLTTLDEDEYPNVRFWHQDSFKEWYEKHGKGGKTHRGELSKKLYFLESMDGQLLQTIRINNIRRVVKSIFTHIRQKLPSALVQKWGHADIELQSLLYAELSHQFDEFRYCEDNWKVRTFVSIWYGNWNRDRSNDKKAKTEEGNIKRENNPDEEDDEDESVESILSKRPTPPTGEVGTSKKMKIASTDDRKQSKTAIHAQNSDAEQPQKAKKPSLQVANPL